MSRFLSLSPPLCLSHSTPLPPSLLLPQFLPDSSDSLNFIKNYAHNLQRSVQNKNVGSLVHKAGKLYHSRYRSIKLFFKIFFYLCNRIHE